jgi:hypothetical protein
LHIFQEQAKGEDDRIEREDEENMEETKKQNKTKEDQENKKACFWKEVKEPSVVNNIRH